MENVFEKTDALIKSNQINKVTTKVVVRVKVTGEVARETLKSAVRKLFADAEIGTRFRVDIGDDEWLERTHVSGEVFVIVRTGTLGFNVFNKLSEAMRDSELNEMFTLVGAEAFGVIEFRRVSEKFGRALHEVVIALPERVTEESPVGKLPGHWHQNVRIFDGTFEPRRIEGAILATKELVDAETNTYRVRVDAPYGIEVTRIVEKAFKLRKDSLVGTRVDTLAIYEEVKGAKSSLRRKKCPVYNTPIENTIGGIVGDKSIKAMLNNQ